MTVLETARLISRPWDKSDIEPFSKICADPEVMELLGGIQPATAVGTIIEKAMAHQARFGIWMQPLLLKESGEFIGMVGIAEVMFDAPFTPAVEIGWRLAHAHWGKGYVTEMAKEHLRHGFAELGLEEIVAFTVPQNARSRAVMKRLGMKHDPARDFDHPRVGEDMPELKRHVLYALTRADWQASASQPQGSGRL